MEEEEERWDEEDVEAVLGGGDAGNRRAAVDTSEDEEETDDMDEAVGNKQAPLYAVGTYVAAMYDTEWYITQVEAEEPENECPGFTLLKYMERSGPNQFVWGCKDTLKKINTDILREVEPIIPVSSRLWGLPKDVVKEIDRLLRVKCGLLLFCVSYLQLTVLKIPVFQLSPVRHFLLPVLYVLSLPIGIGGHR